MCLKDLIKTVIKAVISSTVRLCFCLLRRQYFSMIGHDLADVKLMKNYRGYFVAPSVALQVTTTLAMAASIWYMAQGRWIIMTSSSITIEPHVQPHSQQEPTTNPSYNHPALVPMSSIARARENLLAFELRQKEVRKYRYLTDAQLFQDAIEASALPPPKVVKPKIAFLFLVRGEIPFEPLWRRYFAGHDERYALYVHPAPEYRFPNTSLFFNKEIHSKKVTRMSRSLASAIRRLFAMALLDPENYNTWFVNLCEATIPLRSFNDTYNYLTGSHHSFVQSFYPNPWYLGSFNTLPEFDKSELRKGEIWMAIKRQHAMTIIQDYTVYAKFVADCDRPTCTFDEEYFPTLLHLRDPAGIANRTVMFVDWSDEHHTSSPRTFDAQSVNASILHMMASLTEDSIHGQHHDTASNKEPVQCTYNGDHGASCFLFARKFHPSTLDTALLWFAENERFRGH